MKHRYKKYVWAVPNLQYIVVNCSKYFVVALKNLILILTIIQLFNISEILALRSASPKTNFAHARTPPEIYFSEYRYIGDVDPTKAEENFRTESYFDSDLVRKNGSHYFIYEENIWQQVFTCVATYPIKWSLSHSEPFNDTNRYENIEVWAFRHSHFLPNRAEPSNDGYNIKYKFVSIDRDFIAFNLTCESIPSLTSKFPQVSSSIFVFKHDSHKIVNQGQTLTLEVSPDRLKVSGEKITLPCKPIIPGTTIALLKKKVSTQNVTDDGWLPIQYSPRIMNFDPAVGFTLRANILRRQVYGFYKCVLGGNENDNDTFVYINVTLPSSSSSSTEAKLAQEKLDFFPHANLTANATIKCGVKTKNQTMLTVASSGTGAINSCRFRMKCCTGIKNQFPEYLFRSCANPQECHIMKRWFAGRIKHRNKNWNGYIRNSKWVKKLDKANGCINLPGFVDSTLVACMGENIEFVEHFFQTFERPGSKSEVSVHPADKVRRNDLGIMRKLFLTVMGEETDNLAGNYRGKHHFYFEVREDSAFPVVVIPRNEQDVKYRVLDLKEFESGRIYAGRKLYFACIRGSYFYQIGGYLRVTWKNGTRKILNPEYSNMNVIRLLKNNLGRVDQQRSVGHIFSEPIEATLDLESVDCFMPVWDSDKWDVLTKPLNILPSVAPKFKEVSDQTIDFALNDNNQDIFCTVISGDPEPKVVVTVLDKPNTDFIIKDGLVSVNDTQIVVKSYEEFDERAEKNVTVIKIRLKKVTHEMQGVYQCDAINAGGRTSRVVRVVVSGRSSSTLIWVLAGVAISMFVTGGFAAKRWYKTTFIQWIFIK